MYSRIIDGEEYTFGVSGKLIMNVLVMYDRQTGSLWSQLLGEAVDGPLKGTTLEFVPSWQTTWGEWLERYPKTVALDKGFQGSYDPYNSYYQDSQSGVIGDNRQDDRLYSKEFVIGVEQDGQAAAYPFSVLNEQPVVNDTVGSTPVLVVFSADSATGLVYDRRVGDQELTFTLAENLVLLDNATGTRWDALSGLALDGPLAEEQLTRVKSTASFWFGWKDWYPQTRVYGIDTE